MSKDILYLKTTAYNGKAVDLTLDVYQPANDTSVNRPAIIWIHGGGFTGGDKDISLFERDLAIDFAKKGYVTININYRLRSQDNIDYPSALNDAMTDATQAFKWLQENSDLYGVDKNHIAFAGYSAGATTVINLCYSNIERFGIDKNSLFGAIDVAGGDIYTSSCTKGAPACLIVHGTADETVAFSSSQKFVERLNKSSIYNVFYKIDNSGHNVTLGYDDISNQITMFLYKQLTGKEITITTKAEISYEYRKVEHRLELSPVYKAKQIDLKIDGKFDEWGDSEIMTFDQIKDVGTTLPDKQDFSGSLMVGWNQNDPTRVYIAATITDDTIQDSRPADGKWYEDDCFEIIYDLSKDNTASPLTKWVIGATGNDLSKLSDSKNTELKIVNQGKTNYYEMAIDITKINSGISDANTNFTILPETMIGFSIAYNDCENNERQHQIGWTAGRSTDRSTFGNLKFIDATSKNK